MAEVVSVSVPGELHKRWKSSGKQISPSTLFQTALETELDNTNRHLVYWSQRALNAEKKLKMMGLAAYAEFYSTDAVALEKLLEK